MGLQEALAEAQRRLETPDYVLHAELKQAYSDLRDGSSILYVCMLVLVNRLRKPALLG